MCQEAETSHDPRRYPCGGTLNALAADVAGVNYVGVKTSIATLFDGSVTCSVFPEIEQLAESSV